MIGDTLFLQLGPQALAALWVLLLLYALFGKPLFAVLGAAAVLFHLSAGLKLDLIFAEVATIVDQPIFVTIPLFVLAGTLMAESDAPARLVRLARAVFGWLPGGLAIVATLCCAFFTAVTGASGVTIVALGGLLYPVLQRDRYPERFSIGLLTTGGSLGLLFVPSLPIIVYGLIAGVDIDTLFIAGIVPGVLLVVVISTYSVIVGRTSGVPRHAFDLREMGRAALGAIWEAPIPFLIILGIYSGTITAVEASAMTALYVLFVEVVVYRDIKLRDVPDVMRKTAVLIGAVMIILAMAMGVKNYLVDAEIPQHILAAMSARIESRITFLLVLNVFLLIVGCLLDIFSATLVVVPLIAPLAVQFGVDPVHLGILFLTNLEIGYLTPPVGINLFMGSLRFDRPVLTVARSIIPFLLLLLVCLAAITFVPEISTALVDAVRGAPKSDRVERTQMGGVEIVYERYTGRDGKAVKHGAYRSSFPGGSPRTEGRYRYDTLHGPWVEYWPNGHKKAEGTYRFGRKHGEWTTWFEDGALETRGTYENGVENGPWRIQYREEGEDVGFDVGPMRDGRRHGHWIQWAEEGLKFAEGDYKDGKLHGVWKNWDETGQPLPDKVWEDGQEVGP